MISSLLLTGILMGAVAPAESGKAIPGYEGQTREVLERAAKEYAGLSSYQDVLQTVYEAKREGSDQAELQDSETTELSFSRPGKLALTTPNFKVITDGKRLWQHLSPLDQYLVNDAPSTFAIEKLPIVAAPWYKPHPVVPILISGEISPADLIGKAEKFTGIKPEKRGEQSGHTISAVVQLPGMQQIAPVQAWFSDVTGLIGEFHYDVTTLAQQQPVRFGEKKLTSYVLKFQIEQVKLNQPIPEQRFVFQPSSVDERLTAFRPLTIEEMQRKLLGRPAPELAGNDLSGKPVRLADLRGKVVLLDFWATWCRPCVQALPKIQKLADKYAGKGVVIIGINNDDDKSPEAIRKFTNELRVSYSQVVGNTQQTFNQYRISGIPALFLIGKNGTVQAIRTGFAPGEELELAKDIDRLLKDDYLVAAVNTRPAVTTLDSAIP